TALAFGPSRRTGGPAHTSGRRSPSMRSARAATSLLATAAITLGLAGATVGMPSDFDANMTVRGKGGSVQLLSAHELTKPVTGDFQGNAGKCHVEEQATSDDGDSDGWASVSRLTLGKDGTTVTKRELITTGLHDLC